MKRGFLVLLLACSGDPKGPKGTVVPASESSVAAPQPVPPLDPHVAARRSFANPGGMWMPQQMTLPGHAATFARLGVSIDPKRLADPLATPLGAIARLGGCSASFVSAEGLVITNHHCVQTALQLNSTPEQNLVEHGFLAKTRGDERPAGPAERIFVAQAFTDVTATVRRDLDAIKDPVARKEEVDKRTKQQLAACEKNRPGVRCKVSAFFRAGMYVLIEELEIRDVRLVYVPARSIGNYGGEIDNWQWPRHTGDFAFYRAYVGKDGLPADPSPDNVPYRPKHFLKVSAAGIHAGDFVMLAGFPGTTTRTKTALEVKHDVEWYYPYYLAHYQERYAIAEAHLKSPGETAIKAGVLKQGVQNRVEKISGVLKGLTSRDLLQRKAALDAQAKAWAAAPGRERHKAAIAKLEQILLDEQRTARADYDRNATFGSSKLLAAAIMLTRWADEHRKPDADRKPGYQERDLKPVTGAQRQLTKQYDRTIDRAELRLALVRALKLPAGERAWLPLLLDSKRKPIDEALIDKTLDAWYRTTKLAGEKVRLDLLEGKTRTAASTDPFMRAAHRIWKTIEAEDKRDDARTGELLLVAPLYADAMREALGGQLAPDANSSMRISYGTVRSFKPTSTAPADAPFTVGSQILGKDKAKDPFDAPPALLAAIRAKEYGPYARPDGELPVNFLSDLDTTGGNSGSAVMNDKGELVGVNFDSTIEGVASDVVFDGETTRKIHVDVRYVLWVMDRIASADHLIAEMGLRPQL